ncbi:MAG: metallopeptidase family protein [Candidatus Brennerbacteria bacterium]|nr:metallopeptidase family protein [Candidatus Brennerbacteria bacterium]
MTDERFEEFVIRGIEMVPERFQEKLKNVAVLIADEPGDEQLESVRIHPESGDSLLGLYEGISNLEGGHTHRDFPDRITIFKLPTLEEAENDEDVARVVADTVRHEIAHHFGMDEDEVARAERNRE